MEEDTYQSNFETVKEMILDENKLVTYVSLSKDLCIHVNDSKMLLTRFVENMKNKHSETDINVSYIISGLSEDNQARTTVASSADIEEIRQALKLVFFEHIYSVRKGEPSLDKLPFMLVSNFEDISLCKGFIKSTSSCIKHTSDEIGLLKSNSLLASGQVKTEIKQKPNQAQQKVKEETKSVATKDANSKLVAKLHETKSEPTVKTEVTSPKKDATNNVKPKPENKKNGINKTQKGIAGFFNKSNSAPSKVLSKAPVAVKQEVTDKNKNGDTKKAAPEPEVDNKMDVEEETKEEMEVEVETPKKVVVKEEKVDKPTKTESKKRLSNGKAKKEPSNKVKKTPKLEKKRKRVLHVSDSESEEEKDPFADDAEVNIENHESEDEIPPTPATNTVKITSGIINPRKKRRLVDKTFIEDGYMLTKKVEVYESCSDEEVSTKENAKENVQTAIKTEVKLETSPSAKKNGPKKKKVSPPQKGKQATLMNFFKKV